MEIIKGTNENFKELISGEITLVDFYADWCGPCQALAPILDETAKEVDFKIVKIDVDNAADIAGEYQVISIPTMMIFKDGQLLDKATGVKQKDEIITWVTSKK